MKMVKTRKSIIRFVFMLGVMIAMFTSAAYADDRTEVASGQIGDNLTWTLDAAGTLTVEGTGATYNFVYEENSMEVYCDQVKAIVLSEGITDIGNGAFSGCSNTVGTLEIPSTVKVIRDWAFFSCGFEEIILPDTLEKIGSYAFGGNPNLTEISIPNNLRSIEGDAFAGCEKLNTIDCGEDCRYYCAVDDVLFDKRMKRLILYPEGLSAASYAVPDGVTAIHNMSECEALTKIILPDGILSIGEGAFSFDTNLSEINIPDTVKYIGSSAFSCCESLETIELSTALTSIGEYSFSGCNNLKTVIFNSAACSIKNLDLPRTVRIVGYKDSTAYQYAAMYGYAFDSIEDGTPLIPLGTNQSWVDRLPTTELKPGEPIETSRGESQDNTGDIIGYQISVDDDYMILDNTTKEQIISTTESLTDGCSTDYDKAKAIYTFVSQNMTYTDEWATIETAWNSGQCNDTSFVQITAAMLYYTGIPNAYAIPRYGHGFNLAFCDSRWIDINAQEQLFDVGVNTYDELIGIGMKSGDLCYYMDNLNGMKLVGIGPSEGERDEAVVKRGIDIPAWVTDLFIDDAIETYSGIVIRGTCGTAAEKLVQDESYVCIVKTAGKFTAHYRHGWTHKIVKGALLKDGKEYDQCKFCGKIKNTKVVAGYAKYYVKSLKVTKGKKSFTVKWAKQSKANQKKFNGYQIRYSTKSSMKSAKKTTAAKYSKSKTIKKLKAKKKYYVQVRTYTKKGGKTYYSKWSKKLSVRTE